VQDSKSSGCLHTTYTRYVSYEDTYVTTTYVSSYYYICVLILLHVSSYYYIRVLILLYMSAYYYIILPQMRPLATIYPFRRTAGSRQPAPAWGVAESGGGGGGVTLWGELDGGGRAGAGGSLTWRPTSANSRGVCKIIGKKKRLQKVMHMRRKSTRPANCD
jgi:hypothetical protein